MIDKVKRRKINKDEVHLKPCPTEIDSHADTHCFGRNFRPMHWTGQECSVSPFLAEYKEQLSIQICTGATSYTLESGELVRLLFGQGLWFGNRMDKSLINPYQCRAYGIPICADPTDMNRRLGIEPEGVVSLSSVCKVQHVVLFPSIPQMMIYRIAGIYLCLMKKIGIHQRYILMYH